MPYEGWGGGVGREEVLVGKDGVNVMRPELGIRNSKRAEYSNG